MYTFSYPIKDRYTECKAEKVRNGKPINKLSKGKGVEFAPLNIPFSRRVETASALFYTLSIFFFPFSFLFCFLLPSWIFWSYVLGNLAWLIYDSDTPNKGGRRFEFMRRLAVWRKFRDYFPAQLIKTAELDPSKNYLFGYHPHGIISIGAFLNFGTEATGISELFPGLKFHFLTLVSNFRFPLFRDYMMGYGACSVTRESMNHLLSKPDGGIGALVVVGGAREAMYSNPTTLVLHLKSRKGFVKVAIQNGAQLVPVVCFGETEVILQVDNPEGSRLRKFQKKFLALTGYAPVLFFGRGIFQYSFGSLPLRRPLITIVGAPIPITKKSNPSQEEIDDIHEQYMEELRKVFYDHREKYGDPKLELIIL